MSTHWEESLRDTALRLYSAARKLPGIWQETDLPNDFKLGASVERGTGRLELRFRLLAGGPTTQPGFARECERLGAFLGNTDWEFEPEDLGLWWEMTLTPRRA